MNHRGMVRFAFCLMMLFVLSDALVALERPKALPMSTLMNKKDPFYVPIPYPKTDREVLTDLRYMLKKFNYPSWKEYGTYFSDAGFKNLKKRLRIRKPHKLIRFFIEGGGKASRVTSRVVRVESRGHHRPGAYTYLLFLIDNKIQKPFLRHHLDVNGRFLLGNVIPTRGQDPVLDVPLPYSAFDDKRIREVLERYHIRVSRDNAAELFHAVEFAWGGIWPLTLMHEAQDGIILVVTEGKTCVNCPTFKVFTAERVPCEKPLKENEVSADLYRMAEEGRKSEPTWTVALDSVNEVYYKFKEIL